VHQGIALSLASQWRTNMQYTQAHRGLATAIMATHKTREASYVRSTETCYGHYTLSIHEAAKRAAPAEYYEPVTCLLTAGYCEIFDWCERVLAS
jgi:hypothetical protein